MDQIWHPYTQHKTAPAPLVITGAKDALLFTGDGREIIDAVSSWWVNPYGHGNEYIARKVYEQILQLDQVIFAGFTHHPALELSKRLLPLLPGNQAKVFFSDNGSTAVEVALKMAIQYFYNRKEPRKKIIALQGAYHGDTFGAMAAGARGKFFEPFEDLVFEVNHIPVPTGENEPDTLEQLEQFLKREEACCFIFEPLVQGAAGMVMYPAASLEKMIQLCRQYGTLTIADEVMTGFGRTGKTFAIDHITQQPDIICLSKCLTGGVLPMALTTCTSEVYSAFHADEKWKTLFHGHSYTGNPVGCAAALASLDLLQSEETRENIWRIKEKHAEFAKKLEGHQKISRLQHMGTILSIELATGEGAEYFSRVRDELYNYFLEENILLRPLGNVIYILPPYCISNNQLDKIYHAILEYLNKASS